MKSKMVYGVPATLLCALALTGCPSDPVVMDDAAIVGDAGPNDSGPRRDAGRDGGRGDSGPMGDTGPAIDTGVMLDTGLMADAGPSDDANVDAFVEPDAFAEPDAFVAPDAFAEPDAFVVPDAAVDAFTPPDAFVMPLAGDVCATALTMAVGATMGTTAGAMNNYGTGTGCTTTGVAGADIVYAITVPTGQRATVTVAGIMGEVSDPSINLVAGPAATCGGSPRTCLAGDDAGTVTTVNTASYLNTTGAPTTIYAVIDSGAAAGGPFAATLAFSTPPAGDLCGSAITLAAGTTMGTTVGGSNDYGTGTSCAGTAGSDIVYAVVVPPSQRATVTVTPGDMTFNPSINLVAGPAATCGGSPRACLDGDDSGMQAAVNSAGWVNTSAAPVTIYAVVDSASATATGPFSVNLSFGAVVPGDVCLGASTLPVGTTMGTTVGASNDYGAGTGCAGTAGPDFVYAVDVPAGQRATVTVAGTAGGHNPSVNLVAGPAATCGGSPRTCIAGDDAGTAATVNSASFTNTGAATTIYAVIDTATVGATGTFTATLAIAAPVVGDICSSAAPLAVGTTMGSTAGASNDYGTGTGCTGTGGADLVYAVTVPAGQRATVTVAGMAGGLDPSINLVDGPAATCGGTPRVCLASDDAGGAATVNTASYINTGAADHVIYAVVDTGSATTTGAFTATLAFSPAPAAVTEMEPNDDGSISTGGTGIVGNDVNATAITNADARGVITVDSTVSAALSPAGDEDVFAIRNTGAAAVMVRLETGAPTIGVCPTADTGLRVLSSTLTVIGSNDDFGADACSQVTVSIPAGTTYYVQVTEFGDDAAIAPYQLSIDFL